MATKTSLVISAANDGKVIQKTLTDINPAADNTALKTWGQMLNSLTTNTYVKSDRIDKTNCDSVVEKLTPSLTLDPAYPMTREQLLPGGSPQVTYVGDGELSVVNNDNTSWCTTFRQAVTTDGTLRLYIGIINSQTTDYATVPHDIVIRSAETENYKAGEWTFTITE